MQTKPLLLARALSICHGDKMNQYSKNYLCKISLADGKTQAMYQLLDPGFIGLIFSCFSEDAQKVCAQGV